MTREITLERGPFLTFLVEYAGPGLAVAFAKEFFPFDWEILDCGDCGEETPCEDNVCLLCGNTVKRTFVVTFTFSVTVQAKDEDDAIEIAGENVNVDVNEGGDANIEYGYDLEADHASDAY